MIDSIPLIDDSQDSRSLIRGQVWGQDEPLPVEWQAKLHPIIKVEWSVTERSFAAVG